MSAITVAGVLALLLTALGGRASGALSSGGVRDLLRAATAHRVTATVTFTDT